VQSYRDLVLSGRAVATAPGTVMSRQNAAHFFRFLVALGDGLGEGAATPGWIVSL
jgi:hypothetical protein